MIKHLLPDQIDYEKWDRCINSSFNGNIYSLSWFLNIAHPEWEALVEDDYIRVMPLPVSKKYGITYMMQPFFIQQLGVFSISKLFPKKTEEFLNAIPSRIKYFDFNLNVYNKIEDSTFNLKKNKNHILDLVSNHDKTKSDYSKNTKRNLKKAEKSQLQVLKNIKPQDLINLFKENKGKDLSVFNDHDYKTLERLIYMAIYRGLGIIYGVYTTNNQLCAAAFFTRHNKRLIFLFSGSTSISKENGAMFHLIDTVIKENSPSQITLDFEGSNNENLARFYKGFGSKEVNYNGISLNKLIFPLNKILNYYLKRK